MMKEGSAVAPGVDVSFALPMAVVEPVSHRHDDEQATATEKKSRSDNDGDDIVNSPHVDIAWTKGDEQPLVYRDKWFAVVFLLHLAIVTVTAVVHGPSVAEFSKFSSYSADEVDMYENYGSYSSNKNDYSSSDGGEGDEIPVGLLPTVLFVSVLAAPCLSFLALTMIWKNAEALLKFSLLFGIGLNVLLSVVTFAAGLAPWAVVNCLFAAILICYAKCVWKRIPYAASNLRAAVSAVRSNLGAVAVAWAAVPVLCLWSLIWSLALVGVLGTDSMKEQQSEWSAGSDDGDLYHLGSFVVCVFLLSFYWTHQVIKNSIRSTVAGTVGTWWFSPVEASSCCSPAVTNSFVRSNTYSLGSICFGSLIVAVLHLVRHMLRSAAHNRRAGVLRCIAQCILLYLERLVEYFNKWAFVYVGLYGYAYLDAGKNVTALFKERGWSAIVADNLVDRLLAVVMLAIGLLVGSFSLFVSLLVEEWEGREGWLGMGFFVGFAIGVLLSSVMMGVLSSAVDTVIVCFAEAPYDFRHNHPLLAEEMEVAWAAAWSESTGIAVVSLGGGPGFV